MIKLYYIFNKTLFTNIQNIPIIIEEGKLIVTKEKIKGGEGEVDSVENILLTYLYNIIHKPESAKLDLTKLPEELHEFGQGLIYFSECILQVTNLADALSRGKLDIPLPPPHNELAAPLKSLHSSLKHLTWQTQQIAKGDYRQRVDFMGDFSDSFNLMTEQLNLRRTALLDEIEKDRTKINKLVQSNYLTKLIAGQIIQWIIIVDVENFEWIFSSREIGDVISDPNCVQRLQRWIVRQVEERRNMEDEYTTELELENYENYKCYSVSMFSLIWHKKDALAFVLTDISSERERLNKLQNIANYDTLTQVYNRRYGMDLLLKWLEAGREFCICFIDIDNLKYVNDKYGHREGDNYILRVIETLRSFSSGAVVSRIGGDEFLLMIEGWEEEAVKGRMELLRKNLVQTGKEVPYSYYQSISYGITCVTKDNRYSFDELIGAADEKMYQYKRTFKLKPETGIL